MPKLPPEPSDKEKRYLTFLVEAIMVGSSVEFTYAKDGHTKWRAGYPCRVGELNNGNLALEAYNQQWTTESGARSQPHKLFLLKDMDNLRQGAHGFSQFNIIGYEPISQRFARVDAEL